MRGFFSRSKGPDDVASAQDAEDVSPESVDDEDELTPEDVFTPSMPAGKGFVGRVTEQKDLYKAGLRVPGVQIIIWGESGAGKSSLVQKVLDDRGLTAITTACTPDLTYDDLLKAVATKSAIFYVIEKGQHTDVDLSVETNIGSALTPAQIKARAQYLTGEGTKEAPLIPPHLNAQLLVEKLSAEKSIWVIEDFHKLTAEVREQLSHVLKLFSDAASIIPKIGTKIIVLGVSESLHDLLGEQANTKGRVIDIQVPPLDKDELKNILRTGERLLNLDFSEIEDQLIEASVGSASLTHALALNCCTQRDVEGKQEETLVFSADDFTEAFMTLVRTKFGQTLSRFEAALIQKRKRKYDNHRLILTAMARLPIEGGTVGEVMDMIKRSGTPDYPSGNATQYLADLQTDERGALIKKGTDGRFRFVEPLFYAYARRHLDLGDEELTDEDDARLTPWEMALIEHREMPVMLGRYAKEFYPRHAEKMAEVGRTLANQSMGRFATPVLLSVPTADKGTEETE